MAEPPVVWIVDAGQWPRALLRAELIERGYEAIGFVRLGHAVAALAMNGPDYPPPRAIVIDLAGQHASADSLRRLAASGALLIATGGAVEMADPALSAVRWAARLPRPVTLGAIGDAVAKYLPIQVR